MDRERLHPVIDPRLAHIAKSLPQAPPWYEPWLGLGPQSTEQDACSFARPSGIPALSQPTRVIFSCFGYWKIWPSTPSPNSPTASRP